MRLIWSPFVRIVSLISDVRPGSVTAISLLIAVAVGASAGPAHANLVSTLAFSGAAWSNGSALSGSITYEYNPSNSLVQIDSADISVTAGTGIPAFTLIYDVPGMTNTASTPGWDYNNATNLNYEIDLADSATGNINMYLDMSGIGATAVLAKNVSGGNYSSLADYNVSGSVYRLANAGTSEVQVPEPSGIGIVLSGALGGIFLARRATPAPGRKARQQPLPQ